MGILISLVILISGLAQANPNPNCFNSEKVDWYHFKGSITTSSGKVPFFRELIKRKNNTYFWTDLINEQQVLTGIFKPNQAMSGVLTPAVHIYDCERKNLPQTDMIDFQNKKYPTCRIVQETTEAAFTILPGYYGLGWQKISIQFKDGSRNVDMEFVDSGCSAPEVDTRR